MADLDDLKQSWQSESGISEECFNEIGTKVKHSTKLLQSTIFRRDMAETFASVIVVVAFSLFLWKAKNWIDWSGSAIIVLAGITIPMVLWLARKRPIASVSAANFRDFVDIEIDYLRRQVLLLRMVGWWYLLPIYIGVSLMMIGVRWPRHGQSDVMIMTVILAISAVIFILIWRLNQTARKAHLEPLLKYYVEMRTALDSGDELVRELPDPPSAFLEPSPRKPMSKLRWWTCTVLTIMITAIVVAAGIAIMQNFDARTGNFIISTTPVVAILMIVLTGIWRRNSV